MAIAIAIAEALVDSRAKAWFVTHFLELAQVLRETNGVVNRHFATESLDDSTIRLSYRLAQGPVRSSDSALKLASMMPLPPDVLEHARRAREILQSGEIDATQRAQAIIEQRRRKLIFALREQFQQAHRQGLQQNELKEMLESLREKFTDQMMQLKTSQESIDIEGHASALTYLRGQDEEDSTPRESITRMTLTAIE